MYQILCDGKILYDPRDEELIVNNPRCKLEVNTVGEASFSIFATHKHYNAMQKLRSVFEILQDDHPIFRGRMTDDTRDFDNIKAVDLEGVMGFFNDSIIRPFTFPDDFLEDADYIASENKVDFFLGWLINQHNSQVQPFQQFKKGNVTVVDPNNYISRSSEEHSKTWEVLKTKLFDSALGGYLCIRYEEDGNYIDYLKDFQQTNLQKIEFGKNLLDLISESDASETYSAILPLGKKKNEISTESDTESGTESDSEDADTSRLTIEELGDGNLTDDIVKSGDTIYSKSAVEKYGFIYAPISVSTWDDVTEAENLQTKAMELLIDKGMKLSSTITAKAIDLHLSDEEVEAFRIYKHIDVKSIPHGHEGVFRLTKLEIDIQNPQNTVITLGDTQLTLTDINSSEKQTAEKKLEIVKVSTIKLFGSGLSKSESKVLTECDEKITSSIQQFSKEITLSINGSLGSEASIVLSAGKEKVTQKLDLSKVREAFANDKTSATISAGLVTFNAGTLVINSNKFKVSAEGIIEATSGTIGAITLTSTGIYSNNASYSSSYAGWYRPLTISTSATCFFAGATDAAGTNAKFKVTYGGALTATDATINGTITTEYSFFKASLDGGGLELYYDDVLCGTVNTKYWSGASTEGISFRIEEGGNYIMFSHADDTQGSGYTVDYYLNAGWSSNYDEMHIFQTSARFLSDVYFDGKADIGSLVLRGPGGKRYLVTAYDGVLECSEI